MPTRGWCLLLPSPLNQLIWVLHVAILLLFSSYPVVWAVTVELAWVPLPTEMWLFANMDFSTKLLLTSVLSNLTAAAYDYDYGTTQPQACHAAAAAAAAM